MLPIMRDFYVYLLECADGSYYVGLARAGLERGLGEHNDGRYRGYTYSRRPVKLVWSQDFIRLIDAIERERRLKGWRREKKKALIDGRSTFFQLFLKRLRRLLLRQAQDEAFCFCLAACRT